jgi:hypothetical protein
LHETSVYSCNPIIPSSNSHTLFVEELPSSHHQSLVPKEIFPAIRPYQSIYGNLNPPQLTSLGSQSANEPTEEDVANCFDNDDEISPPLDLSPIRDATPDEDSYLVPVTEQPTRLVEKDTDDVSGEIAAQQDGSTRGQEEGGQEEDSEFEFPAEDSETGSDSEADMSPNEEAVADEELSYNHVQSHHSLAKAFLEHSRNHLCKCENEDSSSESDQESDQECVLSLKQMAQYWQALGVPDAWLHSPRSV